MNYKKQAAAFRKKYKLKRITSETLCNALDSQGYTVIRFNGIADDENIVALRDALGVGACMAQSRCFTYRNDKYRLVFIHEDLTEEEMQIALSHEEGHIWNNHLVKDNILGNDVIQEHEANEFSHYLLKDKDNKRKNMRLVVLFCTILILVGASTGIYLNLLHDKAVYTENLYRTKNGSKYHLQNCMYLEDKTDVFRLTKEEFYSGKYEPCEACKPDEKGQ